MPDSLIPCPCPICEGKKVTHAKRRRHMASERRQDSRRSPAPPPTLSSATMQHQTASPPASRPLTSDPRPRETPCDQPLFDPGHSAQPAESETAAFTREAEAAGYAYARAVAESGEVFVPIADDDWESAVPSEEDTQADFDVLAVPAASTVDENNPDPFYYPPKGAEPLPTASQIHPNRAVYLIYVVVLWLHSQFHLPFRACNALLAVFALAFKAGDAPIQPAIHTTLPSVMKQLGAEPSIHILPVCPTCLEVYAASVPKDSLCSKCSHPLFTTTHSRSETPRPHVQYPTKSLAEQLAVILSLPGMEDEMEKSLQLPKATKAGKWTNIFDGKVCQELPSADGSRFFFPTEEEVAAGELRLGVTMGLDWFSYLRSQISASHTSCPISYSIINLLAHHRYRTAYLLLAGIMPGPKEATGDQCQRFLRPIINELLRLWKHGIVIVTPKYPQGRLVRVALVAVVCDKPAAHKIGGFASHSHTNFCTLCWISQDLKSSPEAFKEDGFPERTDARHRELQEEYLKCKTKSAREAFVREFATRWSELCRLPYFNLCEMIVVDPMHNLFLGVVKTHFYHIWVQLNVLRKTKELRSLHAILSKLRLPAHLGRLPSLIGEPAGGSLTADQWRVFATVVAPLVIPQLWGQYIPEESPEQLAQRRAQEIANILRQKKEAAAEARKAKAPPADAEQGRGKRVRRPTERAAAMDIDPDDSNGVDAGALSHDDASDDEYGRRRKRPRKQQQTTEEEDEARDNNTPVNLHPDDPANFLKLCTALKIYVGESIIEADLVVADKLYREYCVELINLYGPEVIRPNHHYATHTPRNIRNYGPLHEFWTFLFERLNKVLKSYKTPNHAGGELESSFFREFQRTVQQSRILAQGASEPVGSELQEAVQLMYRATDDDRGTLQGLARNLDLAREDDGIGFQLSPRFEKITLPPDIYARVLQNLQLRMPTVSLHSYLALAPSPESKALSPQGFFFDHAVVNNRRYLGSFRAVSPASSWVAVRVSDVPGARLWVGELCAVLAVKQDNLEKLGTQVFGYVRWFRPASIDLSGTVWATFKALTVQIWAPDEYLTAAEDAPDSLINLRDIVCHVAELHVIIRGGRYRATIPVATI